MEGLRDEIHYKMTPEDHKAYINDQMENRNQKRISLVILSIMVLMAVFQMLTLFNQVRYHGRQLHWSDFLSVLILGVFAFFCVSKKARCLLLWNSVKKQDREIRGYFCERILELKPHHLQRTIVGKSVQQYWYQDITDLLVTKHHLILKVKDTYEPIPFHAFLNADEVTLFISWIRQKMAEPGGIAESEPAEPGRLLQGEEGFSIPFIRIKDNWIESYVEANRLIYRSKLYWTGWAIACKVLFAVFVVCYLVLAVVMILLAAKGVQISILSFCIFGGVACWACWAKDIAINSPKRSRMVGRYNLSFMQAKSEKVTMLIRHDRIEEFSPRGILIRKFTDLYCVCFTGKGIYFLGKDRSFIHIPSEAVGEEEEMRHLAQFLQKQGIYLR